MTVMDVGTSQLATQVARQRRDADWAQLQVGQNLTLRVLSKIAQGRYAASAGGERHVVESHVPLDAGTSVRARVTAVGEKVELKYLGPAEAGSAQDERTEQASEMDPGAELTLDALQEKYRVELARDEQLLLQSVSRAAAQPHLMALGGLFLNKLGVDLDEASMRALYAAHAWHEGSQTPADTVRDISALIGGEPGSLQALAGLMADAVDPPANRVASVRDDSEPAEQDLLGTAAQGNSGDDSRKRDETAARAQSELARRLLNTQDLGSVAYHFGSLPVMLGDQLLELDLVLFRDHAAAARTRGIKKLVMSLRTQTLGRVEIVAQSVESRLSVFVRSDSERGSDALAAHGEEVKQLLSRLGWSVDTVSYRLAADPQRAAGAIVDHVLRSGTLDAIV